MNGSNPLLRFAAGVVAVVIALRVAVDLLRPIAPWLAAGVVLVGVVLVVRWWCFNRW